MKVTVDNDSWRYPDGVAKPPTEHLRGRGMWHPVSECSQAKCRADSPAEIAPVPTEAWGASMPRLFCLVRHEDVSGVSGVGTVAQGVQFDNGQIALQWCCPGLPSSMSIWPNLEDLLTIHGHRGRTEVVWADRRD